MIFFLMLTSASLAMSSAGSSGCLSPTATAGLVGALFALATRWTGSCNEGFSSDPQAPAAKQEAPAAVKERRNSRRAKSDENIRGISLLVLRLMPRQQAPRQAQFHPWILIRVFKHRACVFFWCCCDCAPCSKSRRDWSL